MSLPMALREQVATASREALLQELAAAIQHGCQCGFTHAEIEQVFQEALEESRPKPEVPPVEAHKPSPTLDDAPRLFEKTFGTAETTLSDTGGEVIHGPKRHQKDAWALGRGKFYSGGIIRMTFVVVKSHLNDGGKINVGIVGEVAAGTSEMGDAWLAHLHTGGFSCYDTSSKDFKDFTVGAKMSGEPVFENGLLTRSTKKQQIGCNGAIIEVEADTHLGELRFRVTPPQMPSLKWKAGVCRTAQHGRSYERVKPPERLAPCVRLFKAGDAVELRRVEHFLPSTILQEQLALHHELLAVDVDKLSQAVGMPDPAVAEDDLTRARTLLEEARGAQQAAEEGRTCTFVFVDAARLRESTEVDLPLLLQLQELEERHPDWIVRVTISFATVCTSNLSSEYLAVSHRWDNPGHPDPNGVQLRELRKFLEDHKHIKFVWYDYLCMYQGKERSAGQLRAFSWMLRNVNMLYLGCSVLILLDRSYQGRFWTQFEAWLSLQKATPDGLQPAAEGERRCEMRCVHEAPESLATSIVHDWSSATAAKAYETLGRPDIAVTNQSDKDGQLPKILKLDERVRDALRGPGGTALALEPATPRDVTFEVAAPAMLAEDDAMDR